MNEIYNKHGTYFNDVKKFIESHRQVEMRMMREFFNGIPFEEFQNIIATLKQMYLIQNKNGILVWIDLTNKAK